MDLITSHGEIDILLHGNLKFSYQRKQLMALE